MRDDNNCLILVLAFLRPLETLEILSRCLKYTSHPILLTIDGPKSESDLEVQKSLITSVRKLSEDIAIVHSSSNKGCRQAVLYGLQKALEVSTAETIVVLEDDCLPSKDFFKFINRHSQELKTQYLSLSGAHPFESTGESTHESKYTLIHGWAMNRTKLRELLQRQSNPQKHHLQKKIPLPARVFWKWTMKKVELGEIDTWDAHWMWASWTFPENNLIDGTNSVKNVGTISTRSQSISPSRNSEIQSIRIEDERKTWDFDQKLLRVFFQISWAKVPLWLMMCLLYEPAKKIWSVRERLKLGRI